MPQKKRKDEIASIKRQLGELIYLNYNEPAVYVVSTAKLVRRLYV